MTKWPLVTLNGLQSLNYYYFCISFFFFIFYFFFWSTLLRFSYEIYHQKLPSHQFMILLSQCTLSEYDFLNWKWGKAFSFKCLFFFGPSSRVHFKVWGFINQKVLFLAPPDYTGLRLYIYCSFKHIFHDEFIYLFRIINSRLVKFINSDGFNYLNNVAFIYRYLDGYNYIFKIFNGKFLIFKILIFKI